MWTLLAILIDSEDALPGSWTERAMVLSPSDPIHPCPDWRQGLANKE